MNWHEACWVKKMLERVPWKRNLNSKFVFHIFYQLQCRKPLLSLRLVSKYTPSLRVINGTSKICFSWKISFFSECLQRWWFSIECVKTKTSVITQANHSEPIIPSKPIKSQRNVACAKRGKRCASQSRLVVNLFLIRVEKVARVFLNQSRRVVAQNQSNRVLHLTWKWKTSYGKCYILVWNRCYLDNNRTFWEKPSPSSLNC